MGAVSSGAKTSPHRHQVKKQRPHPWPPGPAHQDTMQKIEYFRNMKPILTGTKSHPIIISFSTLSDTRDPDSCIYPLVSLVFIVLVGTISGAKGWDELHEFAVAKRDFLLQFIQLPKTVPSADTLRRAFEIIKPNEFEIAVNRWFTDLSSMDFKGDVLSIDGKSVQNPYDHTGGEPFLHYLHIYSSDRGFLVLHKKIPNVGTEPKAAIELISKINIEGAMITGDANFCNRKMTKEIDDKKAFYLFSLKENREDIFSDVNNLFEKLTDDKIEGTYKEEKKSHGRNESREIIVTKATDEIKKKNLWGNLKTLIKVVRIRESKGKIENNIQYYISNETSSAENLARNVRQHWAIENNIHWELDVIFKEDGSRERNKTSAANLSVVRKISLTLLQKESSKKSISLKQKRCSWDDEFLTRVLTPIFDYFKKHRTLVR